MRVGLVGLGNMGRADGGAHARRRPAAHVYDLRDDVARASPRRRGATSRRSLAALAAASDVVVTMLPDGAGGRGAWRSVPATASSTASLPARSWSTWARRRRPGRARSARSSPPRRRHARRAGVGRRPARGRRHAHVMVGRRPGAGRSAAAPLFDAVGEQRFAVRPARRRPRHEGAQQSRLRGRAPGGRRGALVGTALRARSRRACSRS